MAVVAAVASLLVTTLVAPAAVASDGKYALGDSVMLGARTALKQAGFRVDAVESRQAYSGPAMLRRMGDRLPANVVVHLGTNGSYPLSSCTALVKAAGPQRRVFLVTVHVPRSWERANNRVIVECARQFPEGRVTVIDWNEAASNHPGWLYGDGIHLKPSGGAGFARLINTSVEEAARKAHAAALAAAAGSGHAALEP
jgi:hypothetical protein